MRDLYVENDLISVSALYVVSQLLRFSNFLRFFFIVVGELM
jgi:hypothetical protein